MKLLRRSVSNCIKQHRVSDRPLLAPSFIPAHRLLHTTPSKPANPVNHPPAPGPPPKPPVPAPSLDEERVLRKKRQAELVEKGKNLRANPSQPGTALNKRFWKDVRVKETPDGYQIHLDARPVRTPSKHALMIPLGKPHLASAIALEWDLLVSAQQALKQHYVPLTSLVVRALDIANSDLIRDDKIRDNAVTMLMGYLTTDTLLCWAPEKKDPSNPARVSLRSQQKAVADPIIKFLTAHVWPGVELYPALGDDSIFPTPQPDDTVQAVRRWVRDLPAWELAALERAVLASKSLCIAARLLVEWSERWRAESVTRVPDEDNNRDAGEQFMFTIEDAAAACSLEVRWQTGMWGEVEDTHDVEKEDLRRQLGSVVLLISGGDS